MPFQAYFESEGVGDWYDCIEAASPGESPAVAPEKWQKVEIPAILERFIVERAVSLLLGGEGQIDKRRAQERMATDALDDTIYAHGDRGDFSRPEVGVR